MRGAVRRRSCRWSNEGAARARVETRISALGTPRPRTVGTTTGRPSMPAVSSVACGVSDLKAGRLRRRFARSASAGRVSGRRGGRSGSAPFFADCPHGVCRAPATPHVEAHEAFFERFITRPRCGAGTKGHASSACVIPAKAGIHRGDANLGDGIDPGLRRGDGRVGCAWPTDRPCASRDPGRCAATPAPGEPSRRWSPAPAGLPSCRCAA